MRINWHQDDVHKQNSFLEHRSSRNLHFQYTKLQRPAARQKQFSVHKCKIFIISDKLSCIHIRLHIYSFKYFIPCLSLAKANAQGGLQNAHKTQLQKNEKIYNYNMQLYIMQTEGAIAQWSSDILPSESS